MIFPKSIGKYQVLISSLARPVRGQMIEMSGWLLLPSCQVEPGAPSVSSLARPHCRAGSVDGRTPSSEETWRRAESSNLTLQHWQLPSEVSRAQYGPRHKPQFILYFIFNIDIILLFGGNRRQLQCINSFKFIMNIFPRLLNLYLGEILTGLNTGIEQILLNIFEISHKGIEVWSIKIFLSTIFPGYDGGLGDIGSRLCLVWISPPSASLQWVRLSSSHIWSASTSQTSLVRGPADLWGKINFWKLWQHPHHWQSSSPRGNLPQSHHHRCMCRCSSHPLSLPCSLYLQVRIKR